MKPGEVLPHDAIRDCRAAADFGVQPGIVLGSPDGEVDIIAQREQRRRIFAAPCRLERYACEQRQPRILRVQAISIEISFDRARKFAEFFQRRAQIEMKGRGLRLQGDTLAS